MKRRQWIGAVVVAGMAIVAASSPVTAQQRTGVWLGVGGGWGSANVTCDGCAEADREDSGTFYINGGYAFNPRVLIGAETNIWAKSYENDDSDIANASVSLYNLLGTLTFYPSSSGVFLKAGGGLGWMDVEMKGTSLASGLPIALELGMGPAFIVGAGYDFSIGPILFTAAANYWYGSVSELKYRGQPVLTGVSHNVVTTTIGVKIP